MTLWVTSISSSKGRKGGYRGTKLFMSVKLICHRATPFLPQHISGINDQALSGAGHKKKN